ncbi:MAG: TetR/AcrR family transcriptional regulator [Acidimicrobiales bacterium]
MTASVTPEPGRAGRNRTGRGTDVSPPPHSPPHTQARTEGSPLTRAEKKQATRIRLLDAAETVFAARGFAEASLDEIAEVAGLTKGAVYSNFDKKLDLLLAVLDERMNRRFMEITEIIDTTRELPEQAEQGGRLFMEAFQEERDLYLLWLECSVQSVHDDDVREALVKLDHAIRDAVGDFIAHHAEILGIELPMPATQLATAVTCLADGLALERMKDSKSVPDDLFGTVLLLLYRGLGARSDLSA